MKLSLAFGAALLTASAALAQSGVATATRGTVVANNAGGDWYSPYQTVGTPASSYLHGLGDVIQSEGVYNRLSSEAAINMTEADRLSMENAALRIETWFRLQQINHDLRFPPGRNMTADELARINRAMGPKPLSPGEFDRTSGRIYWPELLRAAPFDRQRTDLEELFDRWAATGSFGTGGYVEVRRALEVMLGGLRMQIRTVPTDQYVDSRRFLEGLAYEARVPRPPRQRAPLISSVPAYGSENIR